jgi:hypothetical protein
VDDGELLVLVYGQPRGKCSVLFVELLNSVVHLTIVVLKLLHHLLLCAKALQQLVLQFRREVLHQVERQVSLFRLILKVIVRGA